MDLGTDSDTDSQEYRITHETKRLRHVFEPYFKKIFTSNGFIKHMNQRCGGINDSTSYILLCEAIKRNDNRNAMALLRHYCKANMGSPDPSKDIPLQLATLAGNVEIVEMLLNKGARVNISFQDQKEPLHLICDTGSTSIPDEISRIAIAKLLIKHGANVNAVEKTNKDTPLILAVKSKFLELTKFLLNNGSDRHYANKYSETAFHAAFSENAGIEMIELLYDKKFDLYKVDDNECTVFSYAVRNLMNSGFGSFCSLNEPLKPILFLLKRGVSVNSVLDKRGNKILHMICQNHAVQTMKIFLDHGAQVNIRNVEGKTPLHFCAENQSLSFIELLISYGADVNILTNNGQSVIHFAAANKHYKVLESLLKHGLNVNAKGKDGNFTPLFNAVWSNRYENVKLLLDWQANVNERIINSQIVLHVAVDQKHADIVNILLEHGSDINVLDDYGNTALTISLYQVAETMNSDWSDDDMNVMRPAESVQRVLTKHAAKLLLSGLFISDQSLRIMNNSHFKDFFEDCVSELTLMKDTEIIEGVTFFDALTKHKSKLLSFMCNDNFINAFNDSKYKEKFPIYCDNVEQYVEAAKVRLNLLKISSENLVRIVQNVDMSWIDVHLPSLVIEQILSYLNTTDLKNMSLIYSLDS
ncbi:putative ankyrin repeat protein RF_0381 [Nasonia vitripennis]|uniref:PRANC domain-containing protein n=1 Tax=Nasonia vitripennis TaxID=7425 RepID=A0A7M7GGF2_NASVI|nr:putative ankyrin repeat protein RF_0381 [Nasonia vitripennis]